jgi:protease-4
MRKKHPVVFGILLLGLTGMIFFLLVYAMGLMSGQQGAFMSDNKVGIVEVEGSISDSQEIVRQLNEFGKEERIRAVVLRVNSPGGGMAPSQEIYDAVVELKKKKKVVVSMGSLAASGGYLISCAADKIVANPGTITGSISAVMHFANVEELLKKVGLKSSVIKSGKYKDIGSPLREMTEDEKTILQDLVDDIYDQFLDTVSRDRKIAKEQLRRIADGRVFSGRQAQKLGLVDFLGDMGYAVRLAGKMSGIEGIPEVVYPTVKSPSFWDFVLRNMFWAILGELQGEKPGLRGSHYLLNDMTPS